MQLRLHAEQFLGLGLSQLEHRDTGGGADDLGDHVLVHDHLDVGLAFAPGVLLLLAIGFQLLLLVAQFGGLLEVLALDGLVLVGGDLGDLLVEFLELRRGGQALDAQACTGLIDQVDGLIRQVTVLDVPAGQLCGGLQRAIGDGHVVVVLVTGTQALQDLDGLGDGRLVHLNRLETTFQSRVLLDVLAVLVGGSGTNGLELATGQHRLQHVGGTQCAVGRAGAHDGVNLVDEQHDVATSLDFLQHLLQTLLEITTVAGAGHHGTEVQRVDLLALQGFRHVAGLDFLGQAFDHGGLAHSRFADQHRIVLGASGKHDHDAFDLVGAADDRVQLAFGGFGRQIASELVEDGGTGLVLLVRHAAGVGQFALAVASAGVAADHIDGRAAQFAQIDVHLDEHLGAHALTFADQSEQDVLGADVAVAQLQGFTQRKLQHLLGVRGKGDVPVRRRVALADHLFDLLAGGIQLHALRGERLGGHALTFADQAEQQVFGANVVVLKGPRLFLRQHDHAPCTVGKPFEHACPSSIDIPSYSTDSR